MNKKPKILLHAMTFMRDFGFVYSLSLILKKFNCDTFVCSNTDYISYPMYLWKPDAVFYVTIGRTDNIANRYPLASMNLWNAESCRFDTYPPFELEIASNPQKYKRLNKVFLWGEKTKELILQHAKNNNWQWINNSIDEFNKKFIVTGHPRIDLAKFSPPKKTEKKIRVGFIGLCAAINNGKFSIPELILDMNKNENPDEFTDELYFQIKYYNLIRKIISDLNPDQYTFSLRPYFLENLQNYNKISLVKSGILHIDNSIEFTTWLKNQDIVIGAVSTTMYLVAAAQKSYISVDYLLQRPINRIVFAAEYLSGIQKHCPKNYEELKTMIFNYKDFALTFDSSPILSKQKKDFLQSNENLPALFIMAREIIKSTTEIKNTKGLPTGFCDLLNSLHHYYAQLRGINRQPNNYSHFAKSINQVAEKEFMPTVENILNNIPDEHIKTVNTLIA